MKRPSLVNPQRWDPLQKPGQKAVLPRKIEPVVPAPEPIPLTRKQIIKRNSMFLNISAILFLIMGAYFLYSVYLERKVFNDYLNYLRAQQEPPGPSPAGNSLLASKRTVWDM